MQAPNSGGLFTELMNRAQGQGQPAPKGPAQGLWSPQPPPPQPAPPPVQAPPPVPAPSMPTPQVMPNPHTKTPPAAERFKNGQQIQQAYANGWQPNPVLLRVMLGR